MTFFSAALPLRIMDLLASSGEPLRTLRLKFSKAFDRGDRRDNAENAEKTQPGAKITLENVSTQHHTASDLHGFRLADAGRDAQAARLAEEANRDHSFAARPFPRVLGNRN